MSGSDGSEGRENEIFKGHGHIDKIENQTIFGWCCDLNRPSVSLLIEARATSGQSVLAVADIYRKDVHDANFGNGNHGFAIDVSGLPLMQETVTIYFLDDGSPLNQTPIDLDPERSILNGRSDPRFASSLKLAALKINQAFKAAQKYGSIYA